MTRAVQETVSKHRSNVSEDLRTARRVQTVAPIIYTQARNFEAPGVPSHFIPALYDRHFKGAASRELECHAKSGRTGAEDNNRYAFSPQHNRLLLAPPCKLLWYGDTETSRKLWEDVRLTRGWGESPARFRATRADRPVYRGGIPIVAGQAGVACGIPPSVLEQFSTP